MSLHKKKYQHTILYFCHFLKGEVRGKKKLAKLLYYVDFDFYEKEEHSITGDIYKALPMGPFPVSLETVTADMVKHKLLQVTPIRDAPGLNPTEVYRSLEQPDRSIFSTAEYAMIQRVVVKYGHLTGKQLEDLTHAEAPYVGTVLKHEIPYELAFYRGTDFTES